MSAPSAGALERARRLLGERARVDEPLGRLTTYRVGGPAAIAVTAASIDDLRRLSEAAADLPVVVVGRGSNLLVSDAGFAGIAVLLDAEAFGAVEVHGHVLRAGGAVPLPTLARRSVAAGLTGMEWAVGVPGSVGGGVRMNAGGHGSDIAAILASCRVVDVARPGAGPRRLAAAELDLGMRHSGVSSTQVVIDAELSLRAGDPETGQAVLRDVVRWRRDHQPGGQNAGSVFVNPGVAPEPDGIVRSAGWLIEACGLKGHRLGSAAVSDKHANFIQADPGGSADDVFALMVLIRRRVEQRWGIRMRTENRLIGFLNSESLQEG